MALNVGTLSKYSHVKLCQWRKLLEFLIFMGGKYKIVCVFKIVSRIFWVPALLHSAGKFCLLSCCYIEITFSSLRSVHHLWCLFSKLFSQALFIMRQSQFSLKQKQNSTAFLIAEESCKCAHSTLKPLK